MESMIERDGAKFYKLAQDQTSGHPPVQVVQESTERDMESSYPDDDANATAPQLSTIEIEELNSILGFMGLPTLESGNAGLFCHSKLEAEMRGVVCKSVQDWAVGEEDTGIPAQVGSAAAMVEVMMANAARMTDEEFEDMKGKVRKYLPRSTGVWDRTILELETHRQGLKENA